MNIQFSRELYSQLIRAGQMVNKQSYNKITDELENNPLFTELAEHLEGTQGYRMLYQLLGYELVFAPDYAYVRDLNLDKDESDETAIKIQAVLVVLVQLVMKQNYHSSLLTTVDAGVPQTLCDLAEQDEQCREILNACGCSKTLWEEADKNLVRRGIAYFNAKQNLVLSNGGQGFLQHIFQTNVLNDEMAN